MLDAQTVYVDDSGTDSKSRIVTAAFCVSTEEKWQEFKDRWKKISDHAGFEHFHMTEFAACRRQQWCKQCKNGETTALQHPWRAWSTSKRENVLNRLAKAVVKYADCGFGLAHTKQDYDDHIRNSPARKLATHSVTDDNFVFAVQKCGGELAKWRRDHGITAPLKFVFDLTPDKQREEISRVFFGAASGVDQFQNGLEQWYAPTSISYESRKDVVQLLAADMLAWVTACIRAREVFMRGRFVEAYQVGCIFAGSPQVRMGHTSKETFKQWEKDILNGARQKEPGTPEI